MKYELPTYYQFQEMVIDGMRGTGYWISDTEAFEKDPQNRIYAEKAGYTCLMRQTQYDPELKTRVLFKPESKWKPRSQS